MPALATFVTVPQALLVAICHMILAVHYIDGAVSQVLEYARSRLLQPEFGSVFVLCHLMPVLRQNKTCLRLASSAISVSLWTWLQGLLWCSSNYEHDLEALVSIYAMVASAVHCCPYFLSPLLLAILLMIGGVELNPGPDFNILAIIILMIASPKSACYGQEATGQPWTPSWSCPHSIICSQN